MPAEPQQISASAISRTSRPGMSPRALRGWARMPWAWPRWQASCQATLSGSGCRGAAGPSSTSSSDRSRTRSEKAAARSAQAGSSRSRWPYSFMAEPQPAALTTTWSTPAASKVSMAALANAWASASRPACRLRAPQQPWPAGATTSQPSAARTRAVAALTSGKNTRWTQPVSIPTRRRGRGDLGHLLAGAEGRGQPLHGGQAPGQQSLQQARPPGQAGQARALVEAQGAAQQPQPPWVGEQPEAQGPEGPVAARARVAALDLLAGGLDQLAVLDPGRAGGDAGHAAQALVEVADHLVVHGLALAPDLHQVDAAPGRVHLLAPEHVGRAGGQAEAAVDAVVDQLLGGRVVVVEGGQHGHSGLGPPRPLGGPVGLAGVGPDLVGQPLRAPGPHLGRRGPLVGRLRSLPGLLGHQMPPTNRPGLRRRSGSNRSLTRRISPTASPGGPHTSTARFSSGDPLTRTRLPPRAASRSLASVIPRTAIGNTGLSAGRSPSRRSLATQATPVAAWTLTPPTPAKRSRPPTRSSRAPASSAGGKVALRAYSAFSNGRAPSWPRAASTPPGPATAASPTRPSSSAAAAAWASTPGWMPSNNTVSRPGQPNSSTVSSTALGSRVLRWSCRTACPAWVGPSTARVATAAAAGTGWSRKMTSATIPRVPSDPQNSLARS